MLITFISCNIFLLCFSLSRLDSGAHFYDTYETSDGRHMSVGAIEPQFYAELISLLGLNPDEVGQFDDPDDMKKVLATRFKEKTQAEWTKVSCFNVVAEAEQGLREQWEICLL